MPKSIKNSKLALIGLIILFDFSLVMAGGRFPKNDQYNTTLRPLSRNETKVLVDRVPAILNEALGSTFPDFENRLKSDTGLKSSLDLGLKELSNPLLRQLFPKASFYSFNKLYLTAVPRPRILEADIGEKLFAMPSNFNRLLIEHNLEINDKNIVELAKAFVIIALDGQEITFLEGKRIKEGYRPLHIEWDVEIKCRIDGEVQTWKFSQSRYYSKGKWIKIGQLAAAMSFVNNKALRYYQINRAVQEEEE